MRFHAAAGLGSACPHWRPRDFANEPRPPGAESCNPRPGTHPPRSRQLLVSKGILLKKRQAGEYRVRSWVGQEMQTGRQEETVPGVMGNSGLGWIVHLRGHGRNAPLS